MLNRNSLERLLKKIPADGQMSAAQTDTIRNVLSVIRAAKPAINGHMHVPPLKDMDFYFFFFKNSCNHPLTG